MTFQGTVDHFLLIISQEPMSEKNHKLFLLWKSCCS